MRIAVIPDMHMPYHHPARVEETFNRCQGSERWIFLGDVWDAYSISDFDRDPSRIGRMQEEFDQIEEMFAKVRERNPRARIDFIEGNHEERLPRYLKKKAPELFGLRSLQIEKQLNLNKYEIHFHKRSGFKYLGARWKHGTFAKKHAGESARAEMAEHRCDGFSAHTHRLCQAKYRDREGWETVWWEAGHLCDETKAEYNKDSPNWNPGYLEVFVDLQGNVKVKPIELQ